MVDNCIVIYGRRRKCGRRISWLFRFSNGPPGSWVRDESWLMSPGAFVCVAELELNPWLTLVQDCWKASIHFSPAIDGCFQSKLGTVCSMGKWSPAIWYGRIHIIQFISRKAALFWSWSSSSSIQKKYGEKKQQDKKRPPGELVPRPGWLSSVVNSSSYYSSNRLLGLAPFLFGIFCFFLPVEQDKLLFKDFPHTQSCVGVFYFLIFLMPL